ncbi:MAG: D-alanine--D-alanine ligase [Patescibacteria group bacterium]|nr:D-alanine--D-alanine ligase [Patescibacteria group bacterium]
MKKRIGLILGGPGNESDISIISAKNIAENFDFKKYSLVLMYWRKNGEFNIVKNFNNLSRLGLKKIELKDFKKIIDIAFPITHGRFGEDGILQAMLENCGIKYCGCRVLSSALCMDKSFFKNFIKYNRIPQVRFASIDYSTLSKKEIDIKLKKIKKTFNLPIFVKPSNSGSSIGISRVNSFSQLPAAINKARRHDQKILIEQGLKNPQEIEVAVIGNHDPLISKPGEIVPVNEFYDFDDKYKLNKTQINIPAKLTTSQASIILNYASRAYRLCDCRGFARIDFFINNNRVYINEINTLPGFTDISMFPRLLINEGLSYKQILNRIIGSAF